MEPQFKSSFIPKKDSVVASVGNDNTAQFYGSSSVGLFDKLATGLFVLTLCIWGGLFAYQKYIESSITKLEQEITQARTIIDQNKVDLFIAFGKQIKISKQLLNQHISLTPLFELLEKNTIPSVQFVEFDFTLNKQGDLEVEILGNAKTFADVARQEEVMIGLTNIKNLSVDTVVVSESLATGGVNFTTSFVVPRQGVLYQELVKDLVIVPTQNDNTVIATTTTATTTDVMKENDSNQKVDELFDELDNTLQGSNVQQ